MRTPALFIAGNESGYQQGYVTNEAYPHHVIFETRIHAQGSLDITRDLYLPTSNGLVTFFDQLLFKSTAPDNEIRLSRYQCVTRVQFNGKDFAVQLEPGQALCLATAAGAMNLQVEPEVDCPLIIRAGEGSSRIHTGAALADISLGAGNHYIKSGEGLVFIRTATPATTTVDGHYLKGMPGSASVLARSAPGDEQFSMPLPQAMHQLGAEGLEIIGSDLFKREINEYLDLFRRLECGQALLTALERPGRGYPVRIVEQEGERWTAYSPSTEESEEGTHFIGQGQAGLGLSGGTLAFAPYRAGTVELPVFELYRGLCMAWNSINGTVFPGEVRMNYQGRQIDVPAWELQAIGISTGRQPFDFGLGEGVAPGDTNPAPFNEQSLRAALSTEPFMLD